MKSKSHLGGGSFREEAERLTWALTICAQLGLRITSVRRSILKSLSKHLSPVSLEMISHGEELRNRCDPTTIYRTLMLLTDLRIVRQVNVRHKTRYFVLNVPGESFAYLICRNCDEMSQLEPLKPAAEIEQQVAARGYTDLDHELDIHGICPACREIVAKIHLAAKLPITIRSRP